MARLTLREALASDRLDAWVREQQDDGAELATGSELERGLALLITRRRLLAAEGRLGYQATMRGQPSAMGNCCTLAESRRRF